MNFQSKTIAAAKEDRMLYFIELDYGRRIGRAFVERNACDMDRRTTVNDIAEGQFTGEVVRILECNPVENICNDVTDEILAAAEQLHAKEYA